MGRIAINEAEKYVSSGKGADFFSLQNDRDTAKVRFMYNDISDVEMDVVHEVEINGKKRFVNCLRTYDQSADECPLCKAGNKQEVKMFIPLYDSRDKKVKIWQRGRTFANQISGLASRFNPLCGVEVEIERQGRKGDTSTKYQIYATNPPDNTTMEDLPEVPKIIGGLVMDKTYDELTNFVETGSFDKQEVTRRGVAF